MLFRSFADPPRSGRALAAHVPRVAVPVRRDDRVALDDHRGPLRAAQFGVAPQRARDVAQAEHVERSARAVRLGAHADGEVDVLAAQASAGDLDPRVVRDAHRVLHPVDASDARC